MSLKQDIFFFAGQNSDDSLEVIEQGDYLYAENLDNLSVDGNNKQVSQVARLGNVKVPIPEKWMNPVGFEIYEYAIIPPYTTSRDVIGSVVDESTNKVYVFLRETIRQQVAYDKTSEQIPPIVTLNYRTILEYDHTKREFTNLVVRTPLAIFSFEESIKWGNVIRGHLTWTQLSTENPKEIEIERAINFTKNQLFLSEGQEVLPNSYSSMTLREFDVIRVPPTNPPRYQYGTDETILTNNIRGNLFQFRYRYVYIDGSESVWSPISKVAIPENEITVFGTWVENKNNKIIITVNRESREIKEIIIASRTLTEEGELAEWKEVNSIDVVNETENIIQTDFFNDTEKRVISTQESSILFHSVPLVAGTQEIISNPDRLIYGNVKDQYVDNIRVDASLEVVSNEFAEEVEELTVDGKVLRCETRAFLGAHSIIKQTDNVYYYKLIGDGIMQVIKLDKSFFTDDWIPYIQSAKIKLTIFVGNFLRYYESDSISLAGIDTYEGVKSAIVSQINADFSQADGIDAAFKTYESWKDACGYENNGDIRKVRVSDEYINFAGWSNNEAVFLRAGVLIKNAQGQIGSDNYFPEVLGKGEKTTSPPPSETLIKATGFHIGLQYITASEQMAATSPIALSFPFTPDETWLFWANLESTYSYVFVPFGEWTVPFIYNFIAGEGLLVSSALTRSTLTPFGRYGVGVVYLDEKKRPITYVQNIDEISIERPNDDYLKHIQYDIKITANNLAPSKAFYWIPVITNNLNQATFTEIDLDINVEGLVTDEGDFIGIDANKAILEWHDKFKNTGLFYKTFDVTDLKNRWRILGYNKNGGEYFDREIINVTEEGLLLIQKLDLSVADVENTIVRVYRPQKTFGEEIYYEVGDVLPLSQSTFMDSVGNIGKRHQTFEFEGQSQTHELPLIHNLNFGDVYISVVNYYKSATTAEDIYRPTYNEFFLPFYQSKLNSKGRVHVKQNVVKTAPYQSRLRYGNAFIQGANFMGLTSFDSLDIVDLPEKHGTIRGLAEVGYTLKVIMDTKPVSIYLQRTLSVDPVGEENVLLTQSAIGTVRIPENNYGTIYADTILKKDRAVYWLDVNNGCVVRDAANGQFPISNYKYSSYIKEFCQFVKDNSNNLKLFSSFQKGKDELYIIVKNKNGSNLEMPQNRGNVIVFSEKVNRWTGHLRKNNNAGVQPEWAETIGDGYLTFLQGDLYIEEIDEENKLFFYDMEHEAFIRFVFNEHPKKIKIPLAISIQSNKLWHCKNNGDITIPANENYKEMSSRILPSKFKKVEGKFYSEFMKDGNSKNNYQEGVVGGRALRGSVALITLRANDKNAKLFSATIRYITSERSY